MVKRVFDFATRIGTLAWNRALPVPGRDPSRWRLTADGWPVFYRFRSKQNGLFSYQLDHKKAPPKGEEQKKEFYKSEENCQLLGVRVNHAKGSHNDKGIEEFEKYQHHIKPCSYWMDLLEIFACGDVTDENGRILWASYSKEEMRKMTKASRMKASVPQYPTPGCIGDLCTLQCQMAGASSFALRYLESVKDGQHVNEAMLEDERERLTRLTREMSHKLLCIEYQLKWVEMKLLKDKEHKNHIVEDTLFKAAFDGDLARVKDIMKSLGIGIDNRAAVFSLTNKNGFGVLHCAACQGHLEVCKYLVEELGGDPNVTAAASEGLTPFMASAKSGDVSTVKYLLDHGGELMKSDEKGFTVLHHAAFTELDGSLLYDAHVVLQFGYYWLFIVIYSVYSVHVIYGIILRTAGSCNVTEFLLSKGIPVDIDFGHGTPLLHAAMVGQDKTLKILLHHHANPNIIFSGVGTPLMAALVNRSLKCMKLLIKAGADVNGKGTITSPLLFAAEQGGYTNFIQLLLKAGADPNIPDDLGRLPVDLAALNDCRDEVEMLFPLTLPIPGVPNWSVDGVISHAKLKNAGPLDEQCIKRRKDILKSQADMAFKRKEYDVALKTYDMLLDHAPDATRDSNRSLCKLLMGDGKGALSDAYRCKMMRPDWAKACYRQAAAHMLLKEYKQAHDALLDAQNLDPGNDEIKRELRKATELMKTSSEP